jgi:hypothetical protein
LSNGRLQMKRRIRGMCIEFQMTRRQPEAALQRAVVTHLRARPASGIFWCAVPNGGYRSKTEAAIMVGTGLRKGCPDILLCRSSQLYALELKAPRGRLSEAQRQCHEELRQAGAIVEVASDLDSALSYLERWKILRGVAQ